MSSVTTVVQPPNPTQHAAIAPAEQTQPATAFADLLDKSGDVDKKQTKKAEPEHPVYSFAQLGMFGLHAAEFPSGDDQKVAAGAKATAYAKPDAADKKDAGTGTKQTAVATPLVYVPFIYGDASRVTMANLAIEPVATSKYAPVNVAVASHANPPSAQSSAARPQTGAGVRKSLPEESGRDASDVSVTVTGPDEGLAIALRAEPSTEVIKLRRLIEATVAHFEMDIAKLHFNGTSIDTAFSLGGMNGNGAG